jgi:hypothetical protein
MLGVIENKLLDVMNGHINNNDNKSNIIKVYNSYSKKYIYECEHVPTIIPSITKSIKIEPIEPIEPIKPFTYIEYLKNCKANEKISLDKFTELFNQYKLNYSKIRSFNINNYIKNKLKEKDIENIYNFIFTSRYISIDIKFWIQQNINNYNIYKFEHLDFYHFYKGERDLGHKEFVDNVYAISKWIYNINPIYKIKLYFFDTPIKKTMSCKKSIRYISSQNASSGFTSINESKNYREIFIWRREEFFLILIHELFHYLLLDTKFLNQDKYITIINYKIGGTDTIGKFPLLINETITEIMAEFFYLIVISVKNNEDFLEIYKKNFIHSWHQFSKIMNYYNIKTFDSKLLATRFNQTTNIFSYFILKCLLETEFCNIIFAFPYIYHIFMSNDSICDINECPAIVTYISKKMIHLPIKLINEVINHCNPNNNNNLKRTFYPMPQ